MRAAAGRRRVRRTFHPYRVHCVSGSIIERVACVGAPATREIEAVISSRQGDGPRELASNSLTAHPNRSTRSPCFSSRRQQQQQQQHAAQTPMVKTKELKPPAELVEAIQASEDGSTAPPESEPLQGMGATRAIGNKLLHEEAQKPSDLPDELRTKHGNPMNAEDKHVRARAACMHACMHNSGSSARADSINAIQGLQQAGVAGQQPRRQGAHVHQVLSHMLAAAAAVCCCSCCCSLLLACSSSFWRCSRCSSRCVPLSCMHCHPTHSAEPHALSALALAHCIATACTAPLTHTGGALQPQPPRRRAGRQGRPADRQHGGRVARRARPGWQRAGAHDPALAPRVGARRLVCRAPP